MEPGKRPSGAPTGTVPEDGRPAGGLVAPHHPVVQAYCDAVTALAVANAGTPAWWYLWMSSRDRFNSKLLDRFRGIATYDGIHQKFGAGWPRLARTFVAVLLGRFAALTHPARIDSNTDIIVIVPALANALRPMGPYNDTYFGPLLDELQARGELPMLLGNTVSDPATVRALGRRQDIPAASLSHFLRFTDILAALSRTLRIRFSNAGLTLPDGTDIRAFVDAEFARERANLFEGLLVETGMRRVLRICSRARVLHTYENNPWERAVDRAAHTAIPRRDVTGYLHCAVLPSHLKNYLSEEEQVLRPSPDRIVCTGPAARDIFLSLGRHEAEQVIAGCALRGAGLDSLDMRDGPPERIGVALAVLEALPSTATFLTFLARAADLMPGRKIFLRPHPAMPLQMLLPLAGLTELPAGLSESFATSLESAIAEADAVLYVSSTAAMTSLAMGVPVIKVRLDELLEDDPLFACDALKRVIERPDALEPAIAQLESMSPSEFTAEFERGRAYLRQYLAPADESGMRCFERPPAIRSAGE